MSRCGSALVLAALAFPSVTATCQRVPAFFRPSEWERMSQLPLYHERCVAFESSFATAMGWSKEETVSSERWSNMAQKMILFPSLLLRFETDLRGALGREDLLPRSRVRMGEPFHRPELSYLVRFLDEMPVFMVPMILSSEIPALCSFLKAVAVTGYLQRKPDLTEAAVVKKICDTVPNVEGSHSLFSFSLLAPKPGVWSRICGQRSLVFMASNLSHRDFYYALNLPTEKFQLYIRASMHLSPYRGQPTVYDEEVLRGIDLSVAVEAHPLYKTLCVTTGLFVYCKALYDLHQEATRDIPNVAGRLAALRTLRVSPFDVTSVNIGLEQEYGLRDQLQVVGNANLVRFFQKTIDTLPDWPLLRRVLLQSDITGQEAELRLVDGGVVLDFVGKVKSACEANPRLRRCTMLREGFAEVVLADLENAAQDPFAMHTLLQTFLRPQVNLGNMRGTPEKLALFKQARLRPLSYFQERNAPLPDCPLCLEPCTTEKRPVCLCPEKDEFPGHWACEPCSDSFFTADNVKDNYKCPCCRSPILFYAPDEVEVTAGSPAARPLMKITIPALAVAVVAFLFLLLSNATRK